MVSLLEEGLREVTLTSIRLRLRRVTKIHHDVLIFLYFFIAPFDTPPLAGGREDLVSLLEEGLREVTLTSIRLSLRRVTKIHHDVFICYYFFSAPFDTFPPWRRTTQGTASKQKVLVTTSEKLRLKSWIPLKSRRKVYDLACLNWLHSNYSKWQNPISKFFPWYFA